MNSIPVVWRSCRCRHWCLACCQDGIGAASPRWATAGWAVLPALAKRSARRQATRRRASLRYFRFHSGLPHPAPAVKRDPPQPGSGWPEQCPPMQAAQTFGWDVINPFEIRFDLGEEGWQLSESVEVGGGDLEQRGDVGAFDQDNCWQWDPKQVLPHRISPHVFPEIRNQAKVSTYLYLQTPPGWALLMSDLPNSKRRREAKSVEQLAKCLPTRDPPEL
ncbi:unnamed protein product [Effrenium voratum]|nr:unnamed protein product [Effrenium voratum]